MPDGHDNAGIDRLLDKRQSTFPLWSQSEYPDPAAGGLLVATELVPVGITNVLCGMGTPGTVFRRDVGPFNVEPDEGGISCFGFVAGLRQSAQRRNRLAFG